MPMDADLAALVRRVPKVELHMHIEGSLEPELAFALARRNRVTLPFADEAALRAAYDFSDLQSFLDLYYAGCAVLQTKQDFQELTTAYFRRAAADNVVHAEIFFDPQTHTTRGVALATVLEGIAQGRAQAKRDHGISSELILCFLRHLSEEDALATLEQALPLRAHFIGVGLDSGERGNPPAKFARVFARARAAGLRVVAHAGEEGPAGYVSEALDLLHAERIDHGIRCEEDPALVERLARSQIPLTVCPLSNLKLRVVPSLAAHNLKRLLDRGLCVTVNSDDPAYFGGYLNDNFLALCAALPISRRDVVQLALNAVQAAFLPEGAKQQLRVRINDAA